MTVISTTVTRVKPGRREEAVAGAAEAKKVFEPHGAKDCRLFFAGTAGETSGTYALAMEFDNGEAWGAFVDEIRGTKELEAFRDRLDRQDRPTEMVSRSLGTEIPLDRSANRRHGPVVQAYVSRVLPGRLEAVLDLSHKAFDFVEGHGATNARLIRLVSAGAMTDALVATWEFETMRAMGAANDAFQSDPKGQSVMEIITGPDCPITPISSGTYAEVPI